MARRKRRTNVPTTMAGDEIIVEKVEGVLVPLDTKQSIKRQPGPALANREGISDTSGNIVGLLTEQENGSYSYKSLKPEIAWEARFPNVVLPDDIDASVWMRDPTIALGDYVSTAVRMGGSVCEICNRAMPYSGLALAVMTRPASEPGVFEDFKDYGFYVECADCADDADTPSVAGGTKTNTKTLGANTNNTSNSWGVQNQWNTHCPDGHFELHTLVNRGGLILSSWRGKDGGKIASNADYCIFFTEDWKVFWQPPVTLFPGTNGSTMPAVASFNGPEVLPPAAVLRWWDFTAPTKQVIEYAELTADLISQGKRVQIGCFGGHGRTGTFAAIVDLKLGLHRTSHGAISWLRKAYCPEAIESKTQEDGVHAYAKAIGLRVGNARANVGAATPPAGHSTYIDNGTTGDGDWSPNDA